MDIILNMQYNMHKDKLYASDKKLRRTNIAQWLCLIFKEAVYYYVKNISDEYSCCMDTTKALDRVKHNMLFELLIERNPQYYFTVHITGSNFECSL